MIFNYVGTSVIENINKIVGSLKHRSTSVQTMETSLIQYKKPCKVWTWDVLRDSAFVAEGSVHAWTEKELNLLQRTLADVKANPSIVTTYNTNHWIASHTKFNAKIPKKAVEQKIMDILSHGKFRNNDKK